MYNVDVWRIRKVEIPGGVVYYRLQQGQRSPYGSLIAGRETPVYWNTIKENADISVLREYKARLESLAGLTTDIDIAVEVEVK